jgi:hypothetical protein
MAFAAASGAGSALTASPSSLAFGSRLTGSTSPAQTVTVSNPNSSAVSVSQLAVSGPFGQASTCGASIPANGSCTISVTFDPPTAGSASGYLTVASSAAGSPLTVALSGTGVASTTNLALNQLGEHRRRRLPADDHREPGLGAVHRVDHLGSAAVIVVEYPDRDPVGARQHE